MCECVCVCERKIEREIVNECAEETGTLMHFYDVVCPHQQIGFNWLIVFTAACHFITSTSVTHAHTRTHRPLCETLIFVAASPFLLENIQPVSELLAINARFCSYSSQWCSHLWTSWDRAAVYQHEPPGLTRANSVVKLNVPRFANLAALITQNLWVCLTHSVSVEFRYLGSS